MVDHESEFYKNSFEKWLKDSDIKMYSAYNDGKSIVAERFIRTLTHKIYKHDSHIKKCLFWYVNNIVDKYNSTCHKVIKMKPINVKCNSYAECNVDSNAKDPKLKIDENVRILKDKNFFGKGYAPNWLEEVLVKRIAEDLSRRI